MSLSLAVPAAKLYIGNLSATIAGCSGESQVKLTELLREGICRFLDEWSGFVPWREEKHPRLSLSTDASNSGWGCRGGRNALGKSLGASRERVRRFIGILAQFYVF